jgi:uncharacterized protein (TIGR00369 family)
LEAAKHEGNGFIVQMPSEKFADETEVRAAQLMGTEFANIFGNVHGGQVLHLVDNLAYVCAARYAQTVCVTASVDRVDFYQPIHVGELLHLVARICYVGRTSIEVEINVFAEDLHAATTRHTNTCHYTMVSLKDGKPHPVPRLVCRTREDKARFIQAKMRREMGLKYRQDRDAFLAQLAQLNDEELNALLADE